MEEQKRLSPKQEQCLLLHLQGLTVVEIAERCQVNRVTASRWLNHPLVQAEIARRQNAMREAAEQAEQAEIQRILTSGYAAIHNRVQDLDRMARLIEQSWHDTEEPDKIIWQWLTPDKLREWRGMLDDIAKELGQRIKKQEMKITALPKVYLEDVDDDGTEA